MVSNVEIIENPKESIDRAYDISLSAREKLLVVFPTFNAFRRNAITKEAWNIAHDPEYKREKIHALSLAKECYSMKLDLLTNATVVDDAIRFASSTKSNEKLKPPSNSNEYDKEESKDIQKLMIKGSVTLPLPQQQSRLFEKLHNKSFWIWDIEEHGQEDIKTNGDCCFNHIIGLPQKDGNDKPFYDYQRIIFDSLVTQDSNVNSSIASSIMDKESNRTWCFRVYAQVYGLALLKGRCVISCCLMLRCN